MIEFDNLIERQLPQKITTGDRQARFYAANFTEDKWVAIMPKGLDWFSNRDHAIEFVNKKRKQGRTIDAVCGVTQKGRSFFGMKPKKPEELNYDDAGSW